MHKWRFTIALRNSGEYVYATYVGPETTPEEVFRKKIANNEFATWIHFVGDDGQPVYVKNSEIAAMDIREVN